MVNLFLLEDGVLRLRVFHFPLVRLVVPDESLGRCVQLKLVVTPCVETFQITADKNLTGTDILDRNPTVTVGTVEEAVLIVRVVELRVVIGGPWKMLMARKRIAESERH